MSALIDAVLAHAEAPHEAEVLAKVRRQTLNCTLNPEPRALIPRF